MRDAEIVKVMTALANLRRLAILRALAGVPMRERDLRLTPAGFGPKSTVGRHCRELIAVGLVERSDGFLRLTPSGLRLCEFLWR